MPRSKEWYRILFDANPNLLWVFDLDTLRLLAVNEAMVRRYRYHREDFTKLSALDLFSSEDTAAFQGYLDEVRQQLHQGEALGYHPAGTWRQCTKDDEGFQVDLCWNALPFDHAVGVLMHGRDVTEELMTSERIQHFQKMDAIGRLAVGFVHNLNNNLQVIMGYSDILIRKLPVRHKMRKQAREIKRASEQAADMTHSLLAFGRKQVLQYRVLDINQLLRSMARMLRRAAGESVHLHLQLETDLWHTRADPGHLQQVVLNLVLNAKDAMPGGGHLTIRTVNGERGEAYTRTRVGMSPGAYVGLVVADSGIGMDADTRLHVFEPFFTTKPVGKGTGLGLSTVYGLITKIGGYIAVDSTPGQGTVFTIDLPRIEAPLDGDIVLDDMPMTLQGNETILVAEDETQVREFVVEILRDVGYGVLSASSGIDALNTLRHSPVPIDLLLSDLLMPSMNGPTVRDVWDQ